MAETKPQNPTSGTISGPDAAKLLMLDSVRRIQQLAAEGYIDRAGQGRYVTVSVIQGYIRFLRDERRNNSENASANRNRDAKTREIELRIAKQDHELVDIGEVEAVIDEIAGTLRSEFIGFPASMTRDLPMRKKLEAGIDGIFTRASARIKETLAALRESGEALDTDAEDDA